MRVDLFDYDLPADRIAQEARPRGTSPAARARPRGWRDRAPPLRRAAVDPEARRPPGSQRREGPARAPVGHGSGGPCRRDLPPARRRTGTRPAVAVPRKAGPAGESGASRSRARGRCRGDRGGGPGRRHAGRALRPAARRRAPRANRRTFPCRRTSGASPERRIGPRIATPTRRSSRASRSPWRRRPPGCTSPPRSSRHGRTGNRDRRPDARRGRGHVQAGHGGRHRGARPCPTRTS